MQLYNQLTKRVEELRPGDPEQVKIYTCGPTVYSYAHIGNLTSYIYWDLLVRTLELRGYGVKRILNLTDVGHLASDADEGEDKLEKGARREGKTVWQVAEYYAQAFLADFGTLNLLPPAKICRATDYIEQDLALVQRLAERGYTYETADGIYFDTSRFPHYADFARLDTNQLLAGARVGFSAEKRNKSDFAVWKFVRPGEDHAMQWDYLGRPGYPGWHLECSTIIHTELGEPIDIHTGGIDHIPVHHTNEIAQTEAAYGVPLARCWTHCNFVTIDGQKISKSLGNIYTLGDLAERGYSAMDFKLWVLQGHYRAARNFSFDDLAAAQARRLGWRNRIARLYQAAGTAERVKAAGGEKAGAAGGRKAAGPESFQQRALAAAADGKKTKVESGSFQQQALAAAADDLNSAEVCALIDNSELTLDDWRFVDELFGLKLVESTPEISPELQELVAQRERARQEKDYAAADALRDQLAAQGISVLDTSAGPVWQYLQD